MSGPHASKVRFFAGSIVLSPLACAGGIALASVLAQDVLGLKSVEYSWASEGQGMVVLEQPSPGAAWLAWVLGTLAVATVNLLLFCWFASRGSRETAQRDAAADEAAPRS